MERLPLFPLNSVLLPGIPISLHIFEERYKLMIGQCIARRKPFGVVLLKTGRAEERLGQIVDPYLVGCSATITHVERVALGRLNIVAVGEERFSIQALQHDLPYLVGTVERIPFERGATFKEEDAHRSIKLLADQYLQYLVRFDDLRPEHIPEPSDPLALAFLWVSLLKTSESEKQAVLQSETADEVIGQTQKLLRREIALLDVVARPAPGEPSGTFSLN